MKISKETFEALQNAINAVGGIVPEATMRQRWDQLWHSKFDVEALYREGLNDNHIDTALRHIANFNSVGELEKGETKCYIM